MTTPARARNVGVQKIETPARAVKIGLFFPRRHLV